MFWKKKTSKAIPLATLLVGAMQEAVRQAEKEKEFMPPKISNLREEYQKLLQLGLKSSKNALELKAQIDKVKEMENRKRKAKGLVEFLKEAVEKFGPKTILVSRQSFLQILSDYSLSVGLLKDYKGVIPSESIADIQRVKEVIVEKNFVREWELGTFFDDHSTMFVTDLYYYNESDKRFLENITKEYFRRMVPINYPLGFRNELKGDTLKYYIDRIPWYTKDHGKGLSTVEGVVLKPDTFMIACPVKYLKNKAIDVSALPVDPIIFQPCPYGILIHTVWGKEAESEVLKRYMEITNKINDL